MPYDIGYSVPLFEGYVTVLPIYQRELEPSPTKLNVSFIPKTVLYAFVSSIIVQQLCLLLSPSMTVR